MRKKSEVLEIIRVGLILFVITAAAALVLAYVNKVTAPVIAQQQEQKMQEAMKKVLPDAAQFKKSDFEISGDLCVNEVYESDEGFVVMATPKGYGGEISMVVGIDRNLEVTGISIISQSETAGLGAKCVDLEWQEQYKGKTKGIEVAKNGAKGNQIDAISSATITSRAVTRGVNDSISAVANLGGDK